MVTKLMSAGDVRGGLEKLDQMGWVHESPDCLKNAAADWLERTDEGRAMTAPDGKAQCLGLAPTHAENRVFTGGVRKALVQSGVLGGDVRTVTVFEPFDTTAAQRRDAREYEPGMAVTLSHGKVRGLKDSTLYTVTGRDESKNTVTLRDEAGKKVAVNVKSDGERLEPGRTGLLEVRAGERLRIGKNRHRDGLVNGQIVTVAGFDRDGRLQLEGGKAVPADFRRLSHGYAVTVASAQGATAKTAVAFGARFKANEMYVAASRATDSMSLHVPDKSKTFESIQRNSGMRKSASEGLAARERAAESRTARQRTALLSSAAPVQAAKAPAPRASAAVRWRALLLRNGVFHAALASAPFAAPSPALRALRPQRPQTSRKIRH